PIPPGTITAGESAVRTSELRRILREIEELGMADVVGLFETREQARRAVEALKRAGLRPDEMSMVLRDRSLSEEVAADIRADDSDSVAVGAVGGGVLGALTGLFAGIGAITI